MNKQQRGLPTALADVIRGSGGKSHGKEKANSKNPHGDTHSLARPSGRENRKKCATAAKPAAYFGMNGLDTGNTMAATVLTMPRADAKDDFARIVAEHESMVFSIGCHFLRDDSLAEDIAQEVFLELYRNLDRIESDAHRVHWLRQVTARKCIDYIRRQRLRPRVGLESAPEPVHRERAADPFLSRQLGQMIASLPARMRMAVVLRYQEEMEPAEIASVMDIPVASVKSTLHRGLELLRSKVRRSQGRTEA